MRATETDANGTDVRGNPLHWPCCPHVCHQSGRKTCQPCRHSFVSPPPNLSALLHLPSACRDPSLAGFPQDPLGSTRPGLQTSSSLSPLCLRYRLTGPWLPQSPKTALALPALPALTHCPRRWDGPRSRLRSRTIADRGPSRTSLLFSLHHASPACWLLKVIRLNHSSG